MFGSSKKSRTFASAIEKQTLGKCPDGGIGRRAGLKHQWIHFHPGSTPGLGTEEERTFRESANIIVCPDGGIGRRAGLKHQWIHFHPGSTPGLGTEEGEGFKAFSFFCIACFSVIALSLLISCFFTYISTFSTLLLKISMLSV